MLPILPMQKKIMQISAEDAVLAVVSASPEHQVQGKKRIQKMSFFCLFCDEPIAARFHIRHFGVFSSEIAEALELLCTFGDLATRDEQVGPNRYFTTVFSTHGKHKQPPSSIVEVVRLLAPYSTPLLEVASTVAFFTKEGLKEVEAIRETKRIKPAITSPERIATTKELLKKLSAIRGLNNGQRPAHT